jgi:hypothetical protein
MDFPLSFSPFFEHDLIRKSVSIPDRVRDMLFGIMLSATMPRGHCREKVSNTVVTPLEA